MTQPSQEQRTPDEPDHDPVPVANLAAIARVLFAQGQRLLAADYGFLLLTDPAAEANYMASLPMARIPRNSLPREDSHRRRVPPRSERISETTTSSRHRYCHQLPISERLRKRYHFVTSSWIAPLMSETRPVGIFALA
jgi:hypothetical protein